jgi:hypothetical protein
MRMTVDQIADAALSLPAEARARLVDLLVESLELAEDRAANVLCVREAMCRSDEVRGGAVQTIAGEEALARVRRAVGR